jgi:hypothetical protein
VLSAGTAVAVPALPAASAQVTDNLNGTRGTLDTEERDDDEQARRIAQGARRHASSTRQRWHAKTIGCQYCVDARTATPASRFHLSKPNATEPQRVMCP